MKKPMTGRIMCDVVYNIKLEHYIYIYLLLGCLYMYRINCSNAQYWFPAQGHTCILERSGIKKFLV